MMELREGEHARHWAESNRELLTCAWAAFAREGEWPTLDALQRDFERNGADVDVFSLTFDMPSALGFTERERLVLRVRGLSFVPEADSALEGWAAALRVAYQRYLDDDDPVLRGGDIREGLGLSEGDAVLVSHLLLRESWAFGSGGGEPDDRDWWREVRANVRAARNSQSAADVLAAREAAERSGSRPTTLRAAALSSEPAGVSPDRSAGRERKVMVVVGRDDEVNKALFAWLRAIDLRPQEWTELVVATGSGSPYTGQVLDKALEEVQAVVVLFTPDDLVRLRNDLLRNDDGPAERAVQGQPRPNVLFEAGLALGRHPDRTVLLEHGSLRGLSDLFGRHAVRLERGPAAAQDLAARLKAAGCDVNLNGNDWLDPSSFPPPRDLGGVSLEPPRAPDPLDRLVSEILEAALGAEAAPDVTQELARRLRDLDGATRGDELFTGLPGRQLPVVVIKRTMYDLEQHGVLKRNPDHQARGYVLGRLPSVSRAEGER